VPAIYELRHGATLDELIALAGGLSTNASGRKVTLERVRERKARVVEEVALDAEGGKRVLQDGDIVNVFTLSPKVENAVTLRGNVAETMRFAWRTGLRLRDVIPERDALVVPDYWVRRNSVGRPESWLRTRQGQDGDLARLRTPQGQDGHPSRPRTDILRNVPEVNWDYAVVERLDSESLQTKLLPFNLGRAIAGENSDDNLPLMPGDVITVFSKDDISVPRVTRQQLVRLEGEFVQSGVYEITPGETLRQFVDRVGGFTAQAYLFGAEFTRESTRSAQQKQLDDMLARLETEAERAAAIQAQKSISPDAAKLVETQVLAQRATIARLRSIRATGRIVLNVPRNGASVKELPDIPLENGDRLYVPPRPGTVSVFGAVYNPNAYLFQEGSRAKEYLKLAGGPTRDAEEGSIYVLHANGTVLSERQTGWFGSVGSEPMNPGDAVIVPEAFERFSLTRELRDWTQILYQFALGVAGLVVLNNL
jgi:protein involved in polysaccharide export with SLBB domain